MLPPRKVQFERRISIPPLQVRRALSGGYGGCLCQWELKAPTDRSQSDCVHEQVAKVDCECPLYLCENGDEVDFVFVPHRMHFFDCETEEAIVL